jgi:DnaJ homolog subfamily C member 17
MADSSSQSVDYYDLLSIPASASESEIRRAYRKTSILYHPDKAAPTPENLEKFHLLQQALNTLTNTEEKSKYDQARDARLRRRAEVEALDARRRGLREELERAEAAGKAADGGINGVGQKRTWSEREVKIQQIKEENRRRMAEMQARRNKEAEEAREKMEQRQREKEVKETRQNGNGEGPSEQDQTMARSVKVRWMKEGEGLEIDQEAIEGEFAAGDVEHVVMLKDKRRRIDGRKEKVNVGTAMVVFTSLEKARKAVQRGPWEGIESIGWAKDDKSEAA